LSRFPEIPAYGCDSQLPYLFIDPARHRVVKSKTDDFGQERIGPLSFNEPWQLEKMPCFNAIYLFSGPLHEGFPSYRKSLQSSKENIQHVKT
jgi:hypothetical protein